MVAYLAATHKSLVRTDITIISKDRVAILSEKLLLTFCRPRF